MCSVPLLCQPQGPAARCVRVFISIYSDISIVSRQSGTGEGRNVRIWRMLTPGAGVLTDFRPFLTGVIRFGRQTGAVRGPRVVTFRADCAFSATGYCLRPSSQPPRQAKEHEAGLEMKGTAVAIQPSGGGTYRTTAGSRYARPHGSQRSRGTPRKQVSRSGPRPKSGTEGKVPGRAAAVRAGPIHRNRVRHNGRSRTVWPFAAWIALEWSGPAVCLGTGRWVPVPGRSDSLLWVGKFPDVQEQGICLATHGNRCGNWSENPRNPG